MRDYQTKSNKGALPDTITATRWGAGEFNSLAGENETAVSSSGQTLAPADGTAEVPDQLARALAIYGAGGAEYHIDTGAVNAYVLAPVSPRKSPSSYFDGFTVSFEPVSDNTGPATVNVAALGVKAVVDLSDDALIGGEITQTATLRYVTALGKFVVVSNFIIATQSEAEAGSDNTKVMTPLRTDQHLTANGVRTDTSLQQVIGANITVGDISVTGSSGGQVDLKKAPDSTLSDDTAIDVFDELVRIFEKSSPLKGAYIDISEQNGSITSKILTDAITNLLEFTVSASGKDMAEGNAQSVSIANFRLPIFLYADPTSVTFTGTFDIYTADDVLVQAGVTPVLAARSSRRLAVIQVTGLAGMTATETLVLRSNSASSKIEVNP